MIALAIILGLMVVILGYTTFNLLRKLEKQEDILNNQATILASYLSYLNKISNYIIKMNWFLIKMINKEYIRAGLMLNLL